MKTKIIAIVVSVVIVAGTATGVGVVVKQANDKNAEELVSAAVSEVMATAESTTEETTTEPTTETTTETTTLRDAKLPARATTTATTTTTTATTTAPAVTYSETVRNNYEVGYGYKKATIDGEVVQVYVVSGSGQNVGKYFYFDKNNNRIYIDNLDEIAFVENDPPEWN